MTPAANLRPVEFAGPGAVAGEFHFLIRLTNGRPEPGLPLKWVVRELRHAVQKIVFPG